MTSRRILEMVLTVPLGILLEQYPIGRDFFSNLRLSGYDLKAPFPQALTGAAEEILQDFGLDREMVLRDFCGFLETFGHNAGPGILLKSVTILGGHDKSGEPEIAEVTVSVGEIVSLVGPTGAGKSRLLADIECLAEGDTPTGRRVLVDGRPMLGDDRLSLEGKLVAQLSQNMNFVMDLTVGEFLTMHAGSRRVEDAERTVACCFACANDLAGEKFTLDTKVTQLSGGQSRALMIADTAHMSASPIVLIDEIENAGIDRRKAVRILARKEKIVLISTHDPLLALSADKRLVIRNGGIRAVLGTSQEEKACLDDLEKLDETLSRLRTRLRQGLEINREAFRGREEERHVGHL